MQQADDVHVPVVVTLVVQPASEAASNASLGRRNGMNRIGSTAPRAAEIVHRTIATMQTRNSADQHGFRFESRFPRLYLDQRLG